MEAFDIISELKTIYEKGVPYSGLDRHLTEGDVLRWSTSHGWSRSQFFEKITRFLALGFNSSELSFEFCDAIVNDLFGPYTDTAKPKSEITSAKPNCRYESTASLPNIARGKCRLNYLSFSSLC